MTTNPLAKSIETGEGILVYATNIVLAIAAILPHGLSWTHTGLYLAILNAVHVLSRSLLKAFAVQKGIGIGAPIPFSPVDPAVIAGLTSDVIDVAMPQGKVEEPQPEPIVEPEPAVPTAQEAGIPESAATPDGPAGA